MAEAKGFKDRLTGTTYELKDVTAREGVAANAEAIAALAETVPVVDDDLETAGAAADAKKTGDKLSNLKSQIAPITESLDFDLKQSADFTGNYYVNQNGTMNNSAKWEMYGFFLENFNSIISYIKGFSNYDYYYQVSFYTSDDRWGLNADTFISDGSIKFSAANTESVILGLTIPEGAKTMVICNRTESGTGEIKGYTRISNVAQDIADVSDYVGYRLKNSPYSYRGAKIHFGNKLGYDLLITTDNAQGACRANDKLFRFNSNGSFNVYDLESKTNLGTFSITGVPSAPHANVAFWGTEKYAESDPYPIVYINAYNNTALPKGALYGLRITEAEGTYGMALVQTILIGFTDDSIWMESGDMRPYGNFVLDAKNNILYAYTIRDTSQVTRFFAFAMPTLESGDKTFAQSDILYRFDVPYIKYPQDNHFDSGNVYIGSGFGDNASPARIYVVNMAAQAISSIVDFASIGLPGDENEPNCVFDYGGKLCCGKENVYQFTF